MKKQFRFYAAALVMLLALTFSFLNVGVADAQTADDGCVIPESGPWPPCATGGEAPPPSDPDCVIPESGPWPPCATGGDDAPADSGDDVDMGDDADMDDDGSTTPDLDDLPTGDPRVDLEIDVDGEKETVGLAPVLVPFDGSFFSGVSALAAELAKEGRSALGGLGSGNQDGCIQFEDLYLSLIAAPIFVDVPSEYAGQVAVYEAGIQKIGDGARDFFLYCFNGGGFSDLSYFLATSNYDEGINILERAAMDAAATFGTPDAPVAPPPTTTEPEQPEQPEEPVDPDAPEVPVEPVTPEEPVPTPPMDGGGDRPDELSELFPGAELFFGNNYPLTDARLTLFLNDSSGQTGPVEFRVNVVPFNGDNFTTVMLWTTTLVDLARTDDLPPMSGGSDATCEDFFAGYLVVVHAPQFSGVPEQYQPWVNQYNDGVQQFLNGARDIAQWCFNGGAFPANSYQPAVDAATNGFNTLFPIVEAAVNEFGVPEALQFMSAPSALNISLPSVKAWWPSMTVRTAPALVH